MRVTEYARFDYLAFLFALSVEPVGFPVDTLVLPSIRWEAAERTGCRCEHHGRDTQQPKSINEGVHGRRWVAHAVAYRGRWTTIRYAAIRASAYGELPPQKRAVLTATINQDGKHTDTRSS